MNASRLRFALPLVLAASALVVRPGSHAGAAPAADPYEHYLKTSRDFEPVKQDKAWLYRAFPSWTFMPWTYQWTIGYDDTSGQWSVEHGYNGAFIDRNDIGAAGSSTGRLDWIDKHQLRFYVDHLADKGYLHLWDGNAMKAHADALHGSGVAHPAGQRGPAGDLGKVHPPEHPGGQKLAAPGGLCPGR